MKAFVWDQNFITGLELVDKQHHFLVDLVNQFGDTLIAAETINDATLQTVFGQLADYAVYHFLEEHRLMLEYGVSSRHRDLHDQHHAEFIEQVSSMWNTRNTMTNPSEVLHGFLCAWLAYHILGEDQGMARQIVLIRAGETPERAYDIASKQVDNSTSAMLTAMGNLYQVLARQNHDLVMTNQNLGERSKELRCIFETSLLCTEPGKTVDEIFRAVVQLVPSGWLYPEIAYCKIVLKEQSFMTDNFMETPWKLSADIIVSGKITGTIEVGYLEEKPTLDEGAFLKEENNLINGIAGQLGNMVERRQEEEMLAEQLAELRRWHDATQGREMRNLELKHEVNELLAQAGQPPRYPSAEDPEKTPATSAP